MRHRYPLPLYHSWPLFERARHFDLGWVDRHDVRVAGIAAAARQGDMVDAARLGGGAWECDLADDSLTWTGAVHELFGFPRDADVPREEAAARYCEGSRAAMERLRAHAITHRRGFTLDVEIRPEPARTRWIRLIAAPVCVGDAVVALHGIKFPLPAEH